MTRAVLFDLGNTLHHLDHAWIAECLRDHGHPATARQVQEAEYHGKHAVDARFRDRTDPGSDSSRNVDYVAVIMNALGVAPDLHERITAAFHAENRARSLWRVLHDDTAAVLAALRDRGLTLAIVSNADGRVASALAANGLDQYFSAIIDSHVVGVEKPDPRIFRLALDACGIAPADALFVGDIYEIDVVGARNAGMDAVLIDPLTLYGEVDCRRITRLAELLEIV